MQKGLKKNDRKTLIISFTSQAQDCTVATTIRV